MEASKGIVLVTGISGFLGSHVGKLLLERGYTVRGTVRDLKNEKKIKPLRTLPFQERLQLVEADLLKPDCWDAAVAGCTTVAHVASPFPSLVPSDPNSLIKPAVEGTLSVLKACAKCKDVKTVVVTSSIAAIQDLSSNSKDKFTEEDWPELASIPPYNQSKTLAERAAWDFYKSLDEKTRFNMTMINPGFILGPALIGGDFTSGEVIRQLMTGEAYALPRVNFGIVDVRDVALAHVLALENPKASSQRYICCSDEHLWFEEIAAILQEEFGKYGYQITSKKVCYCSIKFYSLFTNKVDAIIPFWDKNPKFINKKIKAELGLTSFISAKEAILKMTYSLIENGIVPNLLNEKK